MRKYLNTLHTRSNAHKRGFAFLVSLGVTLMIFGIWSTFTFGDSRTLVAEKAKVQTVEVSPLHSILGNVNESFKAIRENLEDFKSQLEVVNYTNPNGR